MKQEDKELLLKDLCARLPYDIKVLHEGDIFNIDYISSIYGEIHLDIVDNYTIDVSEVKPYLFPLSSMTEEQKEELLYEYIHNDIYFDDFNDYFLAGELWHDICVSMFNLPDLLNWLNKNHFDYRGLIPKGLTLDATDKNIY